MKKLISMVILMAMNITVISAQGNDWENPLQ